MLLLTYAIVVYVSGSECGVMMMVVGVGVDNMCVLWIKSKKIELDDIWVPGDLPSQLFLFPLTFKC